LDRLVRFDVVDMRPSLVAPATPLSSNISRESCIMIPAIYEDELKSKVFISSFLAQMADRFVISRAGCLSLPSPLLLRLVFMKRRVVPRDKVLILPIGVDRNKYRFNQAAKDKHYQAQISGWVCGFVSLVAGVGSSG
jgi:hypothetical protein